MLTPPNHPLTDCLPYLERSLAELLGRPVTNLGVDALTGDASTRNYYRIRFQWEGETVWRSQIVMQLPESIPNGSNDFIQVLSFLQNLSIRVPQLKAVDATAGILILEDCGDETLEEGLRKRPDEKRRFYLQAIDALVQMQVRAAQGEASCPAFDRRFDLEKLMWEFEFMIRHYIEGYLQTPLEAEEKNRLLEAFRPLCQRLDEQPTRFTHRDYHARNLMIFNDELVMIDFQDARMGPCQYDLVSLLKDSYVVLDESFRMDMIEQFIVKKEVAEGAPVDRTLFHEIFDWMSVQRNLKAVGSFAYLRQVAGTERYLQYIEPTLNYVREVFNRRPALDTLRRHLETRIPLLRD